MIMLTDKAAEAIKKLQADMQAEDKNFRVDVVAGGCQGYSYDFGFDEERDEDSKTEINGVTILASPQAAALVDGMTIDFMQDVGGETFIFRNPNASKTCGCGGSFST